MRAVIARCRRCLGLWRQRRRRRCFTVRVPATSARHPMSRLAGRLARRDRNQRDSQQATTKPSTPTTLRRHGFFSFLVHPFQPSDSQSPNLTQVHLHSFGSQEQPEVPGAAPAAPGAGSSALPQHETAGGVKLSSTSVFLASIDATQRYDDERVSMALGVSAKMADGIMAGDSRIAGIAA